MARICLLVLAVFILIEATNSGLVYKELIKQIRDEIEKNDIDATNVETSAGLFEGDIDMDEDTKRAMIGGKLMPRDAILDPIYKWTNGKLYYTFDDTINDYTKRHIYRAMKHIETYTCVRFVKHDGQSDQHYVKFFRGNGCYSRIGRDPHHFEQRISIDRGCTRLGTVTHEIMHSLGFFHEHTRPDRDNFVTIRWDNIIKKHADNFRKYPRFLGTTLNKPYDYISVMHYSRYAFAIDHVPTITTKKPRAVIGQRVGLSYYDAYQINKLYGCHVPCADVIHPFVCAYCKRIGYCHNKRTAKLMSVGCKRTCFNCKVT